MHEIQAAGGRDVLLAGPRECQVPQVLHKPDPFHPSLLLRLLASQGTHL